MPEATTPVTTSQATVPEATTSATTPQATVPEATTPESVFTQDTAHAETTTPDTATSVVVTLALAIRENAVTVSLAGMRVEMVRKVNNCYL